MQQPLNAQDYKQADLDGQQDKMLVLHASRLASMSFEQPTLTFPFDVIH